MTLVETKLRALKFVSRAKKAQGAIAAILYKVTVSNEHASQLANDLLNGYDEWPGPLTAKQMANQCRPAANRSESLGCPTCLDRGMVREGHPSIALQTTSQAHLAIEGGAQFCGCATGQKWKQFYEGEYRCG